MMFVILAFLSFALYAPTVILPMIREHCDLLAEERRLSAAVADIHHEVERRNEMLDAFKQQLVADHVKIDEAGFNENVDFIKAMIRFEADVALFGVGEAWRHMIMVDPQAQAALASFGEAQKLTELNKANRIKARSIFIMSIDRQCECYLLQ